AARGGGDGDGQGDLGGGAAVGVAGVQGGDAGALVGDPEGGAGAERHAPGVLEVVVDDGGCAAGRVGEVGDEVGGQVGGRGVLAEDLVDLAVAERDDEEVAAGAGLDVGGDAEA